jgi:mannonate dehydratase
MKLVLSARDDEELQYAAQLGCDGVMSSSATGDGFLDRAGMAALVGRTARYGLRVEGFSTPPWRLCFRWMLGLPGRDEQIERLVRAIGDMGAVGIPMQVFNMHALRYYRTSRDEPERAGARSTGFDWAEAADLRLMAGGGEVDLERIPEGHRRPVSDEEMWDNYAYFVRAVLPAAEAAGVRLALHPDDPQVPILGGVARIMRSPEAMRRALAVVPSPNLGLKFCVGCYSQMGADVAAEIRALGADKIFLVDFRNVRGRVDRFQETFLDNGQEDMAAVMRALADVGYDGPIGPDHAVWLLGDGPGHERYWAWAIGYMRGLLEVLEM